jgi:muconolactone D-isomerase
MLYLVHMIVRLPHDLPQAQADDIKAREKAYAQDLQRGGKWRHLWRVVGEYANYSVFDVESNDELHEILSGLPLFPYMEIKVTALAQHPSSLRK